MKEIEKKTVFFKQASNLFTSFWSGLKNDGEQRAHYKLELKKGVLNILLSFICVYIGFIVFTISWRRWHGYRTQPIDVENRFCSKRTVYKRKKKT